MTAQILQKGLDAAIGQQPTGVSEKSDGQLDLIDEADSIIFKATAALNALAYGRKELDDRGETVLGITLIVQESLQRLKQISHVLGSHS